MAVIGTQYLTLLDQAKRVNRDGKVAKIAEVLAQQNEVWNDIVMVQGNLEAGHRSTIRTGLPDVYWKLIGQGSPVSKSTTAQVDEQAAILESFSEVDKDLAELGGNVGAFRLSEATAFLEAMNQEMTSTLFYGSAANPEEFVGFANRYSSTSANNGQNILNADPAADGSSYTSVWLVNWSEMGCFGVFPKGSTAGLMHEDMGLQTINKNDGTNEIRQRVYQDRWCWKFGLVVKDWRHAVRIANVDVDDLTGVTGTQATTAATNIIKMMARSLARMPKGANGKKAFYVNRTVASMLHVIGLDYSNSALSVEKSLDQFGKDIWTLSFMGVPIRIVDALTNAESTIS